MVTPLGDITLLLAEVRGGARAVEERLASLVYDEMPPKCLLLYANRHSRMDAGTSLAAWRTVKTD